MTPAVYNPPPHVKGNTFDGLTFKIKINGETTPGLSAVTATFRNQITLAETTFTDGHGLTITDGPGMVFQFNKQVIDWALGRYDMFITITTTDDGSVYTYVKGIWTIIDNE